MNRENSLTPAAEHVSYSETFVQSITLANHNTVLLLMQPQFVTESVERSLHQ